MNNLKILVIDDDATTCNLLETILQMENYQTSSVHEIKNGNIVSLLNKETPHLIILDLHLGSKETLEYVTLIRANATWRHLPVLMTSAMDRRRDCLKAGANAFLLKPFNWHEITRVINEIR